MCPMNCLANHFFLSGEGLPVVFCASHCLFCDHTRAEPFLPLPFYVLRNSCRLCSETSGGCALFRMVQWTRDLHVRACVRVCVRAHTLPFAFSFVTCTSLTRTARIVAFVFFFIRGPHLAMEMLNLAFNLSARFYCDSYSCIWQYCCIELFGSVFKPWNCILCWKDRSYRGIIFFKSKPCLHQFESVQFVST